MGLEKIGKILRKNWRKCMGIENMRIIQNIQIACYSDKISSKRRLEDESFIPNLSSL